MANIVIDGDEALIKALSKIADPEELKKALQKAVLLVERSATEKAPKGNGDLRRSIKSKVEDIGGAPAGIVYTALEYAPYVEFGTGLFAEEQGRTDVPWHYQDEKGEWHSTNGMKPQPFMRPAFIENKQKIMKIIKEGAKPKNE